MEKTELQLLQEENQKLKNDLESKKVIKQPVIKTRDGSLDQRTGELKEYKGEPLIVTPRKDGSLRAVRRTWNEHNLADNAQKDVADINKIVKRHTTAHDRINSRIPISILEGAEKARASAISGDFTNQMSMEEAIPTAAKLRREWDQLPKELKAKFSSPNEFYQSLGAAKAAAKEAKKNKKVETKPTSPSPEPPKEPPKEPEKK